MAFFKIEIKFGKNKNQGPKQELGQNVETKNAFPSFFYNKKELNKFDLSLLQEQVSLF